MLEHGWAVTCQVFIEPDRRLALPSRSGEPPLALDQRQIAQVVNLIWDHGL